MEITLTGSQQELLEQMVKVTNQIATNHSNRYEQNKQLSKVEREAELRKAILTDEASREGSNETVRRALRDQKLAIDPEYNLYLTSMEQIHKLISDIDISIEIGRRYYEITKLTIETLTRSL